MKTLSVCMIVKNENKTIAHALSPFEKIVDEIIVIDTGSIDNTKEIAKKYGAKIFDFKWVDNFSEAKNFYLNKTKCDYILDLEADEYIQKKEMMKVKKVICSNDIDVYSLKRIEVPSIYKNDNRVKFIKLGFKYPVTIHSRLFKNTKKIKWEGIIHPRLKGEDITTVDTNIKFHHFFDIQKNYNKLIRNWKIMFESFDKVNSYEKYKCLNVIVYYKKWGLFNKYLNKLAYIELRDLEWYIKLCDLLMLNKRWWELNKLITIMKRSNIRCGYLEDMDRLNNYIIKGNFEEIYLMKQIKSKLKKEKIKLQHIIRENGSQKC